MNDFKYLRTAICIIASFFTFASYGQKIDITGAVLDSINKEPLIGVTGKRYDKRCLCRLRRKIQNSGSAQSNPYILLRRLYFKRSKTFRTKKYNRPYATGK